MFAVVDIETTGGNPWRDRLMEIAVVVHNGKRVIEQFSSLVNPQAPIPPFVQALTGISEAMVADAPLFEEIYERLLELTDGRIIVAHNARFDYGFLRYEFKRLGVRFNRKQLCTVRTSRKIFPGLNSYSLGNICREIGIPVANRHRAFGDAEATAQLLERLIFNDRKELLFKQLEEELAEALLPPHITRDVVDDLPEEPGVYYFHDTNGKIIYIGKSNNIRNRVISHFSSDLTKRKFAELKDRLCSISFQLTGNELIALILESYEIKRYMPEFNVMLRKKKFRFGLYLKDDEQGNKQVLLKKINGDGEPLRKFTTLNAGSRFVQNMIEKNLLLPSLCQGAVQEVVESAPDIFSDEHVLIHNRHALQLSEFYSFEKPSFFLITEGRRREEKGFVWIEGNAFKGFGYYDETFPPSSTEELTESITYPYISDQDVCLIIRKWMRSNRKKVKMVLY